MSEESPATGNAEGDILDRIAAHFRGTTMYEGRKPTLLEEAAKVIAEEREKRERAEQKERDWGALNEECAEQAERARLAEIERDEARAALAEKHGDIEHLKNDRSHQIQKRREAEERATRAEAEVERLKELCRAEIQNRQQSDRAFLESDQKRHDAEAEAAEYKARYEAEVEHSNAVTRKDPEAALAAADEVEECLVALIVDWEVKGAPPHMIDALERARPALAAYRAKRNGENG